MPTPILTKNKTGVFEARWSENRRTRRKSMGVKDRATAEERFAQWLLIGGHHDNDNEGVPEAAKLTVGELWLVYERLHVSRNIVATGTADYSWRNLAPVFSALAPSEITQEVVDGFVGRRQSGDIGRPSKDSTIRRELVVLRACLNWAADPKRKPKMLEASELPVFDLPPESEPRDRWLSTAEINVLLATAASLRQGSKMTRVERFLWLALNTAARLEAIEQLTWDRVDFEVGMIHYDVPGRKKTKKRRVSVPISKSLLPVLLQAYKERENDLVLTGVTNMWERVQYVVVAAGLAPASKTGKGRQKATGISPHTLRHTAATHMARRGVPLYTIAGVLGNTLAVVEKVYAKHCPAALQNAVNAIAGAFDEI